MSGYDVCKHGRIRCAECAYVEDLEDRIEELEKQNKRYREALSKVRYAIHTQVSSVNHKENSELERGKILGMTFASKMMNRYFDDLLEGEE